VNPDGRELDESFGVDGRMGGGWGRDGEAGEGWILLVNSLIVIVIVIPNRLSRVNVRATSVVRKTKNRYECE